MCEHVEFVCMYNFTSGEGWDFSALVPMGLSVSSAIRRDNFTPHTHTNTHTYALTHIQAHTHKYKDTHPHAQAYTQTKAHTYSNKHTYTYACTHIHTAYTNTYETTIP